MLTGPSWHPRVKSRIVVLILLCRLHWPSANEQPSPSNLYASLDQNLQVENLHQKQVNCLSEIFFETALETAQRLDDEYAASGVVRGPLHGLPVSLKDCFKIEATDATIGYTAFANQPTSKGEESEITKIMRQSGAILFCKTNIPLALMSGEASCVKTKTDIKMYL